MWFALLGCSLPEPTPDSNDEYDEYEHRDPPTFGDGGAASDGGGDERPSDDSADTSEPTGQLELSGGLLVHVSEAKTEYAVCEGLVFLSVTGSEIAGSGKCLLTMKNVETIGDELVLTFDGVWLFGGDSAGRVYAQSDDDSFVTPWTGRAWKSGEVRGEFFVTSSDELGDAYDGEFLLTPD